MERIKSNYKQHIEYWIKNNPDKTLDECKLLHSNYTKSNNYQCIEYYLKRFPDKTREECEVLRKNAVKISQDKQIDKKLGQNNPLSKSKCPEEKRKQNSPYSLEYYRLRFPNKTEDELYDLRKEFTAKRKYKKENHNNTIEYYTSRGYTEEEAILLRSDRQRTFTLEK